MFGGCGFVVIMVVCLLCCLFGCCWCFDCLCFGVVRFYFTLALICVALLWCLVADSCCSCLRYVGVCCWFVFGLFVA